MRENTYLKTNRIIKRMREDIHLRAIKQEIKELKKDINSIQEVLFEFAKVVKKKADTQQELIEMIVKGIELNKKAEEKKIETITNILFAITNRQYKALQEKPQLQ